MVLEVFKVLGCSDYWHSDLGYSSAWLTNIRTWGTWVLDWLAFGLGYSTLNGRTSWLGYSTLGNWAFGLGCSTLNSWAFGLGYSTLRNRAFRLGYLPLGLFKYGVARAWGIKYSTCIVFGCMMLKVLGTRESATCLALGGQESTLESLGVDIWESVRHSGVDTQKSI